jgi:asparagine synthase (glutamine-hydrolysing)
MARFLAVGGRFLLGTHLICDFTSRLTTGESDFSQEMQGNCLSPLSRRLIWQDRYSRLSCVSYEHYPVFGCEDGDFLVHLEGRLYNADDSRMRDELLGISRLIFSQETQPTSRLCRWLLDVDGDFLLVLVNKADGRMAVLNDVFARLPAYFHHRDNLLILSRNLRFISTTLGEATFDRMTLAEYLLLGFPLREKTWFNGIKQLGPASMIIISPQDASIKVRKLHKFNLEEEEHGHRSPAENAHNLVGLFQAACRRRASGAGKNVVSLSGGLDSRAVTAGLWRERLPLAAASFLDCRQTNAGDFEAAARVSRLLGVEWRGFKLPPPQGRDLRQLLTMKNGLNNLRMGFILRFFHQVRESFGPGLTFFTGDGGGDTLGVSCPYRQVDSLEALVAYLIEKYQVFPLKEVAAFTGVDVRDLKGEIATLLISYPERSLERKYKHFYALDDMTQMYNEGEDRNRHFFWSATPFYSFDFFNYAFNCPDRDKKEYRLYREFLQQLHPSLGGIDYANWQAPITSIRFKGLYRLKCLTRARPHLIRRLRRLFKRFDMVEPASNIWECLRRQSATCDTLGRYLDSQTLARVLARTRDYDKLQVWTLFTLTSTIAYFTCPPALGDDFLDRDFV